MYNRTICCKAPHKTKINLGKAVQYCSECGEVVESLEHTTNQLRLYEVKVTKVMERGVKGKPTKGFEVGEVVLAIGYIFENGDPGTLWADSPTIPDMKESLTDGCFEILSYVDVPQIRQENT